MHIIPVAPATVEIIKAMNNGVVPEIQEGEEKFFIFKDWGNTEFVTREHFDDMPDYEYWTIVTIMWKEA